MCPWKLCKLYEDSCSAVTKESVWRKREDRTLCGHHSERRPIQIFPSPKLYILQVLGTRESRSAAKKCSIHFQSQNGHSHEMYARPAMEQKRVTPDQICQGIAMYAYCHTYIKRLAGLGWCVALNTTQMPNNEGLVFKVAWYKTLRMNLHSFGFVFVQAIEP